MSKIFFNIKKSFKNLSILKLLTYNLELIPTLLLQREGLMLSDKFSLASCQGVKELCFTDSKSLSCKSLCENKNINGSRRLQPAETI